MDKYYGISRAKVHVTDNTDYSFFARVKAHSDRTANQSKTQDFNSLYEGGIFVRTKAASGGEEGGTVIQQSLLPALNEPCYDADMEGDLSTGYEQNSSDLLKKNEQNSGGLLKKNEQNSGDLVKSNEQNGGDLVKDEYITSRDDQPSIYQPLSRKKGKWGRGFLVRVLVAGVLFLSVVSVSKIDNPVCQGINEFVKEAVLYDLDAKEEKELGEVRAVTLIQELESNDQD